MGVPDLVLGASGSGKSCSLRNFLPTEVGIFNVASKPLPFQKKLPLFNTSSYADIIKVLVENKRRCYVIDDSQYLMAFYMFAHAKEKGYDKFTNCAVDFQNLLQTSILRTTNDTVVYFLHHIDMDDYGHIKAKTQGRMLDNQLCLEGLFSIVLLAETEGKEHWFTTQSNGMNPAKSPMGMFPAVKIDNDLKVVDTDIRKYWNFNSKEDKNNEKI